LRPPATTLSHSREYHSRGNLPPDTRLPLEDRMAWAPPSLDKVTLSTTREKFSAAVDKPPLGSSFVQRCVGRGVRWAWSIRHKAYMFGEHPSRYRFGKETLHA